MVKKTNVIVPIHKKTFRQRLNELDKMSIDELCAFITNHEIKKYAKIPLQNVTVKITRHPKNKTDKFQNVIYVYSEKTLGFPFTCKCNDIHAGLIATITKIVEMEPVKNKNDAVLMGITPLLVPGKSEKPDPQ